MSVVLFTSARFGDHTPPPGHPEAQERAAVFDAVAGRWASRGVRCIEPAPAAVEDLARVHAPAYLDTLAATAGLARMLDPDTFTSPESWEIARLAAGAALQATRMVMAGEAPRAAALVRPPGHHATADQAMGFCLVNSVAAAAAAARAAGAARVAIVDVDVHHGNGTQAIFDADPDVLFLSLHQWPLYPGTGAADEIGRGDGRGRTVNVPLPPWCADADYEMAFRRVVLPALREFAPSLLLVSAGFDAHEDDPLARMRLSAAGFGAMARGLAGVADDCCDGRLVVVTEGGYDLPALAASLDAVIGELAGAPAAPPLESPAPDPGTSLRAAAVVDDVRRIQAPFWRGL